MGRKAKGGGFVAGGKGDLKALVDLGLEACCGVEGMGGGSSWAAALPVSGRGDVEVGEDVMGMEEDLAGGEDELVGFVEGMGIDPLVHMVLGGGEEVSPMLPAVGGGTGVEKSPVVEEAGGRRLRFGWLCGNPVGGDCMEVAGRDGLHGTILGGPTRGLAVAGGVTGGGGQMGRGSVLGVALIARLLGGGPARGGLAGLCKESEEGF